jgi:hypothetical protein
MGHIEIPHYLKGILQVIGDKNSFQETVLKYEDQIIGPLADSITGNIRDYWGAFQGDITMGRGHGGSYNERERCLAGAIRHLFYIRNTVMDNLSKERKKWNKDQLEILSWLWTLPLMRKPWAVKPQGWWIQSMARS